MRTGKKERTRGNRVSEERIKKGRPEVIGEGESKSKKNIKGESTPKGKENNRGPKLVNQNIRKFLINYTELKRIETDTPVGNRNSTGENIYGCKGVVGDSDSSAVRDSYMADTYSTSNDKRGGEQGRLNENILVQQQHAQLGQHVRK